jgi:polysaccharide deacetylase 2 family uncharacterized protein YibQ
MAEEQAGNLPDDIELEAEAAGIPKGRRKQPPKTWLYLLAAFSVVSAIAVSAGVLTVSYLFDRPVNMVYLSDHMAEEVVEALQSQYVPASAITTQGPERRGDEQGFANYYRFDVAVPEGISARGLKDIIRKRLENKHLTVMEMPEPGTGYALRLLLGDFEFATLNFLKKASPAAAPAASIQSEKLDLRSAARRIAGDAEKTLRDLEVNPKAIGRGVPVEKEDADTRWIMHPIRAVLPAKLPPQAVEQGLEEAMAGRDIMVRRQVPGSVPSGEVLLRLYYAGKPAVELTLVSAISTIENAALPQSGPEGRTALDLNGILNIVLPPFEQLPLDSVDHTGDVPVPETAPPALPAEGTPRLAIILDDGGYGGIITDEILGLDPALTLAILPNTPFVSETAEQALEKGFEVMLHMPMQTHSKTVKPFPGQLNVSMEAEKIRELTRNAIAQVPGIKGVNNHTGSVFTANAEKLTPFLEVLKEKDLFFVDSRTIAATVAMDAAADAGVPAVERDVFLDNSSNPEEIRARLDELADRAKKQGMAVGIGHFRRNTAAVLAEAIPDLKQKGLKLVHVSELIP